MTWSSRRKPPTIDWNLVDEWNEPIRILHVENDFLREDSDVQVSIQRARPSQGPVAHPEFASKKNKPGPLVHDGVPLSV
jgi:hypothetical protein